MDLSIFLPHIVVQVLFLFFKLSSVELQEGKKNRTKEKLFERSELIIAILQKGNGLFSYAKMSSPPFYRSGILIKKKSFYKLYFASLSVWLCYLKWGGAEIVMD